VEPVSQTPTKLVDYAAISTTYAALAGAVLLAARDKGEDPLHPAETIPIGVAAFALSKLIAKEKVETWIREPFVEELPDGEKRPKGRRLRYAVGELLSCSRCLGAWTSLGLVGLRMTRPREARVVTALLGSSAINDFLQAGFTYTTARCDLAQQQAAVPPRDAEERRFPHS
jgi:hypothetical protein